MNSYSLYRLSHRVIFLPFTKSKGTQNVSRGIRLPKPQNKFHALTKESFSDAFIILILLLCESMREECRRCCGSRHAAAVGWSLLCVLTMISFYHVTLIDIFPVSSRCHHSYSHVPWPSFFFFLSMRSLSHLRTGGSALLVWLSIDLCVSTFIPPEPSGSELVKLLLLLPFSSTSRIWL